MALRMDNRALLGMLNYKPTERAPSKDIEKALMTDMIGTTARLHDVSWKTGAATTAAASTHAAAGVTMDELFESLGKFKDAITIASGMRPSDFADLYMTTPHAPTEKERIAEETRKIEERLRDRERAERLAAREEERRKVYNAQLDTLELVARTKPELLGVTISRMVDGTGKIKRPNQMVVHEGLVEVLHNANFDRERYGYDRHRVYSEFIERQVRAWTPEAQSALIEQIERASAASRRIEAVSDPVDTLPEQVVQTLVYEAERSYGEAAQGVW